MKSAPLLLELRTEELPPKSLRTLSEVFLETVTQDLERIGLLEQVHQATVYATPRRMGGLIQGVRTQAPDQSINRKGPAIDAPQQAIEGFARSCGVEASSLTHDQHHYIHHDTQKGAQLRDVLFSLLEKVLKKLPVAKIMRWGDHPYSFVRPIHGVLVVHGSEWLSGQILGITAGSSTLGHRFMSHSQELVIPRAEDYARLMHQDGCVMVSFAERQELIHSELKRQASRLEAQCVLDSALLEEITALVEWPVVLHGRFEKDFLNIPQECLILSMQQHQKYIPLRDASGQLLPNFLLVSNIKSTHSKSVIQGNERVLRARLTDAAFFFEQDCKLVREQGLDAWVKIAGQVVYHKQLGSQQERIERIVVLSGALANRHHPKNDGFSQTLHRAAYLAKADLHSDMVGEFPELQGYMGAVYARVVGESEDVVQAIEEHYRPRFAGDDLPQSEEGLLLALADKLEHLIGMWSIGLKPTGDKDPYGLRRAALGIVRILQHIPLRVSDVLDDTLSLWPDVDHTKKDEILDFLYDRARHQFAIDVPQDVVEAVLAKRPAVFVDLSQRFADLLNFKRKTETKDLIAVQKRLRNILKKAANETPLPAIQPEQMQEEAEQSLLVQSQAIDAQKASLDDLFRLRLPITRFFDELMVMVDDPTLRRQRLALLQQVSQQFDAFADLTLLHTEDDS